MDELDEVCRVNGRDERVEAESHCAQVESTGEGDTGDAVQSGHDPGELPQTCKLCVKLLLACWLTCGW